MYYVVMRIVHENIYVKSHAQQATRHVSTIFPVCITNSIKTIEKKRNKWKKNQGINSSLEREHNTKHLVPMELETSIKYAMTDRNNRRSAAGSSRF